MFILFPDLTTKQKIYLLFFKYFVTILMGGILILIAIFGLGVPSHGDMIFTYELPDHWDIQDSSIKIIDIVKIMGNLVDNAFDATELLPTEERKVHVLVQLDDKSIHINVSNTGCSLDATDRENIFHPGFTTKSGNHSGLGLAIVMERVKHYNGEIFVESNDDQETQFRLTLPQEKTSQSKEIPKPTIYHYNHDIKDTTVFSHRRP